VNPAQATEPYFQTQPKQISNTMQKKRLGAKIPQVMAPVTGQRRAMLNRIRKRARQFGFKDSDVRPKTYLLYALLENDKSSISFRTNEETRQFDQEIRLEKSDAAYIDKIALGLHKVLVISGEQKPANTPIIYYPDANWFGLANEARDLEGLYNSKVELKTDQDVRLEEFWTGHFRHVPEQQYQPQATDPLAIQTVDPFYDLETNFGLWGNKRNEFSVKYGPGVFSAIAGDAEDETDPHVNYAVVALSGFELVRGAESVTVSDANMIFKGM
jgi:hypothetical protein